MPQPTLVLQRFVNGDRFQYRGTVHSDIAAMTHIGILRPRRRRTGRPRPPPHPAHWEPHTVIEIEYVVKDHKGVEKLRTTDKKAADAYDKALETAERLADLLRHDKVLPGLAEHDLEELTIYLARNTRQIERILKGKEPDLGPEAQDVVPSPVKVTHLRAAG